MKQLNVSPEIHTWMKDQLWASVQDLYDDPYGMCDGPFGDESADKFPPPREQIIAEIKLLRNIARVLDVNFDDLVKDTTDYEQLRINKILADQSNKESLI